MQRFLEGAAAPFHALGYLQKNPRLWQYVVIPIVVNLVVATVVYLGLFGAGWVGIDRMVADTRLGGVIEVLLRVVLGLLLLFAAGFCVVRFGVVLGSPWYGTLSEQIEQGVMGAAPPAQPLTAAGIARDIWRALGFELKKLGLSLAVGLVLLLLNLIPVAGQAINLVGAVLLGAFITCLDFFDGPLERRRLRFRTKMGVIRQHMPASLGFGLVGFGLVAIPFVNLLLIPLCVAAGTLFLCEQRGPELELREQ